MEKAHGSRDHLWTSLKGQPTRRAQDDLLCSTRREHVEWHLQQGTSSIHFGLCLGLYSGTHQGRGLWNLSLAQWKTGQVRSVSLSCICICMTCFLFFVLTILHSIPFYTVTYEQLVLRFSSLLLGPVPSGRLGALFGTTVVGRPPKRRSAHSPGRSGGPQIQNSLVQFAAVHFHRGRWIAGSIEPTTPG